MAADPPGPRPAAFVFPFEEARSLLVSYRRLEQELQRMVAVHDQGLESCFPVGGGRFEGRTAHTVLEGVVEQLRLTRMELADVADAIEHLASVLGDAEQQQDQRLREIARWQAQQQAFQDILGHLPPDLLNRSEPAH